MTESIPAVHVCGRYSAGHEIHWIQARLTWMQPVSPTPVEVVHVGDAHLVVAVEDGLRRLQNHDLARLRSIVDHHGPFGALVGHGALKLGTGYLVSILDEADGPLGSC